MNVTTGTNRVFVRSASRLFEFDQNGKYVREIGQGLYGFVQAHAVRVDPQDNIWVVDEGSNMVIKFDPEGHVRDDHGQKAGGHQQSSAPGDSRCRRRGGFPGDNFNGPSDVAWDAAGDIFVADGSVPPESRNSTRTACFIKSWGGEGERRANSALRTRS